MSRWQPLYFSNLLIGASAAAYTWQVSRFLHLPWSASWAPIWLSGAACMVFYGLHDTYTKTGKPNITKTWPRALFWQQHRSLMWILIALVFMSGCWAAWHVPPAMLLRSFGVPLLLALGYTFPILPFEKLSRFKHHPLLKLFVLCGTWASLGILLLPVHQLSVGLGFLWMQRFLFMLLISIPFDVRDAAHDRSLMHGRTLPDLLGNTNRLNRLLLLTCLATLACTLLLPGLPLWRTILLSLHIVATAWLSRYACNQTSAIAPFALLDAQLMVQAFIVG